MTLRQANVFYRVEVIYYDRYDHDNSNVVSLIGGQVAKRGKPTTSDLESTALMTRREQANAVKEFRQRLLLHPKSPSVLNKIIDVALDDDHKQQGVAMKIMADRLLPAAGFTVDGKQNNQVSISITGIGADASSGCVTINGESGDVEDE